MFVNLNDFCCALTVVAINIERGGSPYYQFNTFTVILVRLFVLWFCSFRLLIRIACTGVRAKTSVLLLFHFISFRFVLVVSHRIVYSCTRVRLAASLGHFRMLPPCWAHCFHCFHLVTFVSISLSICRLVFSDREYDLTLRLCRYGFIALWAHSLPLCFRSS